MDETSERRGYRSEYVAYDIWQAAYLDVMGIRFLRVQLSDDGRAQWVFDNESPPDGAFQAGLAFRLRDEAVAPIQRFRNAFRFMSRQANMARSTREDIGYVVATSE